MWWLWVVCACATSLVLVTVWMGDKGEKKRERGERGGKNAQKSKELRAKVDRGEHFPKGWAKSSGLHSGEPSSSSTAALASSPVTPVPVTKRPATDFASIQTSVTNPGTENERVFILSVVSLHDRLNLIRARQV